MIFRSYEAVVFDMDGVIFDSEREVLESWLMIADKYGIPNFREPYLRCIGTTRARTMEILKEAFGEDFSYDEYRAEQSALFHSKNDGGRLPVKPGVREILSYLRGEGKKIGLASSSRRETVLAELRDAGILPYFDEVITGEAVSRSKPAPDIFLHACGALGVPPENAFAIEDSYNGIRSACAAGLRALMVPDLLPATEEMRSLCEAVFESLSDVTGYLRKQI
ncbi:MAG: HAD family phosphatase [Clostridia bacterium]|nr:HAD family phosphatase [Clostridia bacterium]